MDRRWLGLEPAELQVRLHAAATAASAVAPQDLEEAQVAELLEGPVQRIRRSLGQVLPLLDLLVDRQADLGEVADVAFLARWELRQIARELDELKPEDGPVRILDLLATARNRILFSLDGVDRELCVHTGVRLLASLVEVEIRRSLALREAWASFRETVLSRGTPKEADLGRRLEEVAGQLELILLRHKGRSLRIKDRIQLESLLDRIARAREASHRERSALWSDLEAFAGLLGEVNRRSEIRANDLRVAERLLQRLPKGQEAAGEGGRIAASTRRELRRLRGRDDRLDQLAAEPSPSTEEVRARLESVVARLGR